MADIFLPFADMGLICRYALAKNELEIELYFLRKRGKAIFERLLEDRSAIEATWVENLGWKNGAKQSIVAKKRASISSSYSNSGLGFTAIPNRRMRCVTQARIY